MDFSFVVPAYNCATTIERTINSIIKDASVSNFDSYEIIIVENGSTDSTIDVCEAIASNNSRVKLLRSSKGVSAARNTGIWAAAADWILFVDADDKWLNGSLGVICEDIKTFNSDLLVYGFKKGRDVIQHRKSIKLYTEANGINECRAWLIKRPTLRMQVWGKVYKRACILKNQVRFDEKLTFSEDGDFLIRFTAGCRSILVSDETIYEYTTDTASATRNSEREVWGRKTQGYIESMKTSALNMKSESELIRKAFAEYVLIHLNLILVRDVFEVRRKCAWETRSKEMCSLLKNDVFSNALDSVKISECLNLQLLPELFFKSRIGFMGGGTELC